VSRTALVVIDMINPYDHADAEQLVDSAGDVVPRIADLIGRAGTDDVPVIYVNDNFGSWRSNRDDLVESALQGQHPELVEPITPGGDSLFVVKARHSIFFQTPLEYLLSQEGIDRLVLAGQVTEQCVLYSALDAHIRHLHVCVPPDAVAHIHADLAESALRMMELNMGADLCAAEKVSF
jgi:nicotinamidase-related amidase